MTYHLWCFLQGRSLKNSLWPLLLTCPLYFFSLELNAAAPNPFSITRCTIVLGAINFGSVDPMSDNLATSTVTLTCDVSGSYNPYVQTIKLSTGSGSYTTRTLISGTNTLEYNIYTDSARSIVWGDGTSSTSTGSVSFGTAGNNQAASATLYGKIPSKPNVVPGTYTDSITATVTY